MSNILVFLEIRDHQVKKGSLEALSLAKSLSSSTGGSVNALMIDEKAESLIDQVKKYGADKLLTYTLKSYSPDAYRKILLAAIEKSNSSIVIASNSAMATDFIPAAAALLNAGMTTDCIAVDIKDGKIHVKKPLYAGKVISEQVIQTDVKFLTIRQNLFPVKESSSNGSVEKIDVDTGTLKARVVDQIKSDTGELDVSEADIIISGGRGIKGPEGFELLRELASHLQKAAIGASRSAVDSEWIGHQHQVGQTGKTVSPVLYIANGISGKIQHLAGMSSSKNIIAINKDPEAPIFTVADFGIVGDLFKVIPALIGEIKKG